MSWHDVAAVADVPAGRGWPATVAGRSIAVFVVDGVPRAVANGCLHIGSPLDDGWVEDGCVTCPWHGWRYDLASGAHLTAFGTGASLATWPARVRAGRIEVAIGE